MFSASIEPPDITPPPPLPILGTWGAPPDYVAWVALGVAAVLVLVAIAPGGPRWLGSLVELASVDDLSRRRRFLTVTGFLAAFLSLAYVAYYLHGGPRLDDATAYFTQGRALSHGDLAWSAQDPSASFRGRYLVYDGETNRMAGMFSPGYPLLLAAGFVVGAPMIIGPLLAAALALATYFLAKEIAAGEPLAHRDRAEAIGRVAVGISLVCSALRYHTADTLAHGAAALAIALALACALRARRTGAASFFVLAGLAAGYAVATRPASAIAIVVVVVVLAVGAREGRARAMVASLGAMVPGVALLLLANRAATGSPFKLAELAYYAASDGPPGCFRYGFGPGIGCAHEHGAYLAAHQPSGFTPLAALLTTLRRLKQHAADIANLEPLALLLVLPLWKRAKENRAPLIAMVAVVGQVLVFLPFYFDGNTPGAGARLFAEMLPIEHALLAFAVAELAPNVSLVRKALVTLALACVGFAVHTSYGHLALANVEPRRPAYEPDLLREANVTTGILFFETDQGFSLAYDPEVTSSHGVVAVRLRNDDHDRLVFDRFGRPAVHLYKPDHDPPVPHFEPSQPARVGSDEVWRFEAESDWPPLSQSQAWAEASPAGSCASREHVLTVHAAAGDVVASVTIDVPVPREGTWRVVPRAYRLGGAAKGALVLVSSKHPSAALAAWSWSDAVEGGEACVDLEARDVAVARDELLRLRIEATGGDVALDRTQLTSIPEKTLLPAPP